MGEVGGPAVVEGWLVPSLRGAWAGGPHCGLRSHRLGPPGDRNVGDVFCVQATMSVMAFFFFLLSWSGESQKRAVKAENHVLKLKQEVSLLQVTRGSHQFTCV